MTRLNKNLLSILFCGLGTFASMCTPTDPQPLAEEYPHYDFTWHDTLTNALSDRPELQAMDKTIARFMDKWDLRGMSLAVTRNDSLLFAKGYGWADKEKAEKMKAVSTMRIASASKLITGMAIMKLIQDGKISLDSPVAGPDGLLPDSVFGYTVNDPRLCNITVDHLLTHTGGFSRKGGDPMFQTRNVVRANHLKQAPTSKELAGIVLSRKLSDDPGTKRHYSNFGYFLLSLIVEQVTGKPYWDYVQEEILAPIGAAGFHPAGNYYADRRENEVKYYGPDKVKVEDFNANGKMVDRVYGGNNITGLLGAGGWAASAPGLARVVAAMDKCHGIKNVLCDSIVDIMTEYAEEDPICRGWSTVDEDGSWLRTGTLSSAHAFIKHFPDGECWIITTNSGVWIGYKFADNMSDLVDKLRSEYSSKLPRQDLWEYKN